MRSITLMRAAAAAPEVFTLSDSATAEETRAAIQNALDLAGADPAGGTVTLSAGIFVVAPGSEPDDGALRVSSNTTFEGAGIGQTTIQLADNPEHDVTGIVRTNSGRTQADGTPSATHDIVIRDLSIDGNKANTGTALVDGFFCGPKPFTETGIDSNIHVESVEVLNVSRYGFDPHERTDNLTFQDCVAHDNAVDGFTIDNCSNVTLIDCETYDNGRHGVNVVTSSAGVEITGLNAHGNGATGVTVQTGNIEARALTRDVTIEDSIVTGNAGDGIVVRQATGVAIGAVGAGVIVSANGRFGILVEGGREVTIAGNTIEDNAGGTGSDDAQIRVRGYLQSYLDADALNDVFVVSENVSIASNTIGASTGTVSDYAASYSDTIGFTFANDNAASFAIAATIADTSKQGSSVLFVDQISNGDDFIDGTPGADVITGGSGDDSIFGLAGADQLYGADGNDTLDGGTGADTLFGGFGNDVYMVDSEDTIEERAHGGTDEIRTALAVFTLSALANVENLAFTGAGDFTGTGNASSNTIIGADGNDWIDGAGGKDRLVGGNGDDTYCIDSVNDTIEDTGGHDTVRATVSHVLADTTEDLILLGLAELSGTGNDLDNVLTGNAANNILIGGIGNDLLDGGAGADDLDGGTGNDTYIVDDPGDTITDADGYDRIDSTVTFTLADGIEMLVLLGADNIDGTGNAEANVLFGNDGNNILRGLGGDDTLNGGLGTDTLDGGTGNDLYLVNSRANVIIDAGGFDTVRSSVGFALAGGIEKLVLTGNANIFGTGNSGNNTLLGNDAKNMLRGLGSNDFIWGGWGDDTISGGPGRDVLLGGKGRDHFLFDSNLSTKTNVDALRDFSRIDDLIVLDRHIFRALPHGALSASQFYKGPAAHDADDRIIYNASKGFIWYDTNGNAPGGAALFAVVNKGLQLDRSDFYIY